MFMLLTAFMCDYVQQKQKIIMYKTANSYTGTDGKNIHNFVDSLLLISEICRDAFGQHMCVGKGRGIKVNKSLKACVRAVFLY